MKSIICMNLTGSKYYVFSQRGLLRNRISFVDYARKYGQPVDVSPNGLNFILARKNLQMNTTSTKIGVFNMAEYEF